jgi:hypothetical protein
VTGTRDLDLLKIDFDVIAMMPRLRCATAGIEGRSAERSSDEGPDENG